MLVWLVALSLVAWGAWIRYYRWVNPRAPRLYSGAVPWVGCAVAFGKGPPVKFVEKCATEGDIFTVHVAGRYLTFLLNPDYFPAFFNPDEDASGIDFAHATQPFLTRCFGVPRDDYFAGHLSHLTHLRRRLAPTRLEDIAAGLEAALLAHAPPSSASSSDSLAYGLLSNFDSMPERTTITNFRDVVQRLSFAASVRTLFGERVASTPQLYERFIQFDDWFEIASSSVPHVFLPSFTRAKQFLLDALETGASEWTRDDLFAKTVLGDKAPREGAPWVLGVLWASQANTMVTLFWYLLDLMKNPAFTNQARAEAEQAYAKHGKWTADCVSECKLLLAALKETGRLHSAPIIVRATLRPVEFGPYVVPKGHFLCLSPMLSHRRHDLFSEANSWDPLRWLNSKDPEANWKRFANISFGSSIYRCPGQHYAYLQLVLIAAMLITRYDFTLDSDLPAAALDCLVGVQKPQSNVTVSIVKRQSS